MKNNGFAPQDILMVDDLKPGLDMSRTAGVRFAAAGWARQSRKIEELMRRESDYYLNTVKDLEDLLFSI